MIKHLNQDESRELLRKNRTARLGCIADDGPYVVPVNYIFDGECAYLHSLPGYKIQAMRVDPRVCLQVDEIADELNWKSVQVFGTYEEITNRRERAEALNHLLARFSRLTPVESFIAVDAGAPAPVVFRIRADRITGISEGD
ncbi:MAG TPA: pyridoxamine 5'-phosphate oxidase family protein [Pyrinomonadaceae bacterium]|nr:pyridoxamine 5'-phosphate oxidase family protein [Pyrinomonadaceae bacterium]